MSSVTGPDRVTTTYTYDAALRLVKITDAYDPNGNLVHSSDVLGIQRQPSCDALNRLVQTIDNYNGTN